MDIGAYHLHENENHPNKKWFVRSRSLLTLEFVENLIFWYSTCTYGVYWILIFHRLQDKLTNIQKRTNYYV